MGYSSWNDDFYRDREAERARTNRTAFEYDHSVRSGAVETKVLRGGGSEGLSFRSAGPLDGDDGDQAWGAAPRGVGAA